MANAQNGIAALLCNHEFHRTPPQEEIVCRLKQMEDCGADICKIAVMPQSAEDVLTLLSATLEAKRLAAKPIVTMSMGQTGTVSLLCRTGSAQASRSVRERKTRAGQIGVSASRRHSTVSERRRLISDGIKHDETQSTARSRPLPRRLPRSSLPAQAAAKTGW